MLGALNEVTETLAAQGRQPIMVVSAGLRRAFANFLRGQGNDTVTLGVNELPDNRRIEVVASLGGQQGPAQNQPSPTGPEDGS